MTNFDDHSQHYLAEMQFMDTAWAVQQRFDEWWSSLTEKERILIALRYVTFKFGSRNNWYA